MNNGWTWSWVKASALGFLVLGGVGAAGAQMSGQSGVSGRIGYFLPTNSAAGGGNWLSFGADYRLNSVSAPAMTMRSGTSTFVTLSGDYYNHGGFRNIPVAFNYNVRSMQLIFSAGVGVGFQTVYDHETIDLGGQIGATYEFSSGRGMRTGSTFFVQAKYFLASNSLLDGLGLYVGMRF